METKHCAKCKQILPVENFVLIKKQKASCKVRYAYHCYCRKCDSEYGKLRRRILRMQREIVYEQPKSILEL